jgi:D-glycero-D-manno-heptose 1,7-bisphosphate phosphatase
LNPVFEYVNHLLKFGGTSIQHFYYCPHHPAGKVQQYAVACKCRKPEPGLILRAVADLNIDVRQSWMIGDILNDVEAGNRAGCRSILIDNGSEDEWQIGPERVPDFIVRNLAEASDVILKSKERK